MAVIPLRSGRLDTPSVVVTGVCMDVDEAGVYLVRQASGEMWRCRRAASCLLQPRAGDSVMLCGAESGSLYLIAVLEQADAAQARLEVPADLVLSVPNGDLRLETRGALHAQAGRQLDFAADELRVRMQTGDVRIDSMRFVGKAAATTVAVFKHVGQRLEQMVDRFTHSSRSSTRVVRELDMLRAGQIDAEAGGLLKLHGKTTLVTGQDLAKVDAEQIHVG